MVVLAAHFHPVMRSSRLRRGPVQALVGGTAYALWRDGMGTPRALLDRCPHRHAPLSRGRVRPDGRLACGYHGWHFDGNGDGQSPTVPELTGCTATAAQLVDHLGWLWLAGAGVPLDRLPKIEADGWRFVDSYSCRTEAPLHVVVDNFAENEHTPWVHTRLGWLEKDASQVQIDVRCHPDRTEVRQLSPQRPAAALSIFGVRQGDKLRNEWVTRFSPVHNVHTISWHDPDTGEARPFSVRIGFCFVPETDRRTKIVAFFFTRMEGRTPLPRRILGRLAYFLAWKELWDDARWVNHVADTQLGFEGMRLTRFDKPVAHNRKLMDELYYDSRLVPEASLVTRPRARPVSEHGKPETDAASFSAQPPKASRSG